MTADDIRTAEVTLGRHVVRVAEFRFRIAKRALPMLQSMAPRLAIGRLTEQDFDHALEVVAMAAAEADPTVTAETMQDWRFDPTDLGNAIGKIAELNGWASKEPADPNVHEATGGTATGTPSTPT